MHRSRTLAASVALLALGLGACGGDSTEDAEEQSAPQPTSATSTVSPSSSEATTTSTTSTTVAAITTTTLADPDNLILVTANVAGASEPIKVDVLAGEFTLVNGMTAREGSSFAVQESWMELAPGLGIDIGPGGLELLGQWYDAGTRLIVSSTGGLVVAGTTGSQSSAASSVAVTAAYADFCAGFAEIRDTVEPEFATAAAEGEWYENQVLVYEELTELAPPEIRADVGAMAEWMAGFVELLGGYDWDFVALMDDAEGTAALESLAEDGAVAFERVDAHVAEHCGAASNEPGVVASGSGPPSYTEAVAEHWAGVTLCDTQAGISGGPDVYSFGPFGGEDSIVSIREGYPMGFCPGARYIVTGELVVADGSHFPVGTLLTIDAELNFVAVSTWD